MKQRCVSCLTGTRVAGVIGQILISDSFSQIVSKVEPLGFDCLARRICLASWVDNIFPFSNSVHKAIMIQEILEQHLACEWDLFIKPVSR